MKLACSSTAFDELLRSGELTQLEWIDLCAHDVAADGLVFDVRHFPRTDADYLAQLKKMAVDLGLTVAALRDEAFFGAERSGMESSLDIAAVLGAPLLSAVLPAQTAVDWNGVRASLSRATSLAKRFNITLAVRNAAGTFAASTLDMKRISKEADSAWLRYAPEFAAFDAASDPAALLAKIVLVWQQAQALPVPSGPPEEFWPRYRGFVALDAAGGNADATSMKNAVRAWRKTLRESYADRT